MSEPSKDAANIDRLLYTGTPAARADGGFKDLGITPLVRQLGLSEDQTNGHWCSPCQGIWFGYTLEVQCPVCGNRSG